MGQLSTSAAIIESFKDGIRTVLVLLKKLFGFLSSICQRFKNFLRVRIPFVEAYFQRHLNNPAAIYIDIAVFVLVVYISFGALGGYLVYSKKSETRFTETLSLLYPLPAARVDNSFIWSHNFIERLRFLNTFNAAAPPDLQVRPPTDKELREKVLAGLIEDRIILKEARRLNISVSAEELNKSFESQKAQTADFEDRIYQLYGMSLTQFKEILAERLLKEKVKATVLTRVNVRHILVTTPSAANEVRRQLNDGKDFAEVARQFSQDAKTKDVGGELGFWTKGELAAQINQPFEDAAFNLALNTTSEIIQSQFGLHIIQVTEKTGELLKSYQDWYNETLKKYQISKYIEP